jgi:hypothetical protein
MKTFQLSAKDGEVAWFGFVADAAPIHWTVLVTVSSLLTVRQTKLL